MLVAVSVIATVMPCNKHLINSVAYSSKDLLLLVS